jgi:manganese/zinc/iron transport system ATP- binding protein
MSAASNPPALETRRLTASYGGSPAVWDLDAVFPAGALSAVVGPNGAGKSTLMKAALGLLPLDAGTASAFGSPLARELGRIAYVPQREAIDWDFPISVREVVEMGRYREVGWLRRVPASERAVVDAALERVGMLPFADRQVGQLSGGQRQRVFIARALAQRADLMLLDEPFAGVDMRTEASILDLLGELRDEGTSIVLVHHDIETVRSRFDWALLMNVRAVACGPVAESLSEENVRRAYGAVLLDGDGEGRREEGAWAG